MNTPTGRKRAFTGCYTETVTNFHDEGFDCAQVYENWVIFTSKRTGAWNEQDESRSGS